MTELLKAKQGLSFVLTLALLFGVFLTVQKDTVFAVHVPQHYDTTWTRTNLYDLEFLSFEFTNLDVTQQYVFTLQALDINTGFPSINLDSVILGPGVTTEFAVFNYFEGSWPVGSHFPVQLIDNFGQVVSKHFITPFYHDDWITNGAVLTDDKQALGGAVYHPFNPSSYQHEASLEVGQSEGFGLTPTYTTAGGFGLKTDYPRLSIVTNVGEFGILHYQTEDPLVSGTDKIQIRNISTGVLLAEFILSELECYSQVNPLGFWSTNTYTLLPLTTDGIQPGWVDPGYLSSCFVNSTDPSTLTVAPGAYSYGRVTSGDVLIDEGESVWLVTTDPNRQEWQITPRVETLREGREQRLDRRQITQAIHDAFPLQEITDDTPVTIDSTNYTFATFRSSFYIPTPFTNPVTVTWEFEATDLLFGQAPSLFPLFVDETFGMIILAAPLSRTERLVQAVGDFSFDNDTGSIVLLLFATFIAFSGAFALKAPPLLYVVLYLVLVGTFIFLGLFSPEITVLVGISAFAAIMLMFMSPELLGKDRDGL